jgi:hypothetical protein
MRIVYANDTYYVAKSTNGKEHAVIVKGECRIIARTQNKQEAIHIAREADARYHALQAKATAGGNDAR